MCHGPESGNPELMCFLDLFIFLMAGVCVLCWCPRVPAAGVRAGVSGRPVYKHHQARRVYPSRWLATPKDDDTHFQLVSLIGGSYLAVWLSSPGRWIVAWEFPSVSRQVSLSVSLSLWECSYVCFCDLSQEDCENERVASMGWTVTREKTWHESRGSTGIYCCCI